MDELHKLATIISRELTLTMEAAKAMKLKYNNIGLDSKAPESFYTLSLKDKKDIEISYLCNPNIIIEIKELKYLDLESLDQVAVMVNEDHSCWLTNLGLTDSTAVYRPHNRSLRKLAHQQVVYIREGDYIGFYGIFYRVSFTDEQMILSPLEKPIGAYGNTPLHS